MTDPMRKTMVTWLGHAAVQISAKDGRVILIDPWLSNPRGVRSPESVTRCDVLLVTHNHSDHLGDAVDIARRTQPTWPAFPEMSGWITEHVGASLALPFNLGGTITDRDIAVTATPAVHTAGDSKDAVGEFSLPPVPPAGYIVKVDGARIYHAGDTALFGDMRLIGDQGVDLAILPIGGRFTMDPKDAAHAAELLSVTHVLPIHYGTIPMLTGTPGELEEALKARGLEDVVVHALEPGGSIKIPFV